MKSFIPIAAIMLMISGCKEKVDISKKIPGTYLMTSQDIQQGSKVNSYKNLKQLKIYTPTEFMYTQLNPADSIAAFGVGSYETNGDTLTEHVIYSMFDSTISDEPRSYKLFITITPEGYKQTITNIPVQGQISLLTEFYNKMKEKVSSPFDGVWKEQASYLLNAKDTVWYKRIQYKSFYDGYFMFGSSSKDSTGKVITNMGYGNFNNVNDKQFDEMDMNSTYPTVAGHAFRIDYEMPDKDHYKQTIHNQDGTSSVEIYERLK
ncbi:MAG: hypothetical protein ACTHK0_07975 [Ginsengibacter sp.]